jgi:adenosylhomocysteine nucleosidase
MSLTAAGRDAGPGPRAGRILIMAALPSEVRPFLRRVRTRARRDLGLPAWEFEPGPGVVALSGMGAAAARRAGESLVDRCRPDLLVSLGFGGALAPGLAAGNLVLGETFWHYNPDTRELQAGPHPLPPRSLSLLERALKQAGLTAVTGSLVTTTRIIHKGRQGELPAGLPQPVLDLETSALAEVAAAHGLTFLSLRAITDVAGEEIPAFLHNAGIRETTVGVGAALRWLAADFRRLKDLFSLWRRSRLAARTLALALAILWPLLVAAGGELEGQPAQEGNIDENPHPAQATLPDEEGHGQVKAQDAQVEGGAQQGLARKVSPAPIPPGGGRHPGDEKLQDPDEH